jgi:hypothetical protein
VQQGQANTWSAPYTDANKPPSGVITALEARFVTWDVEPSKALSSEDRFKRTAIAGGIVVFPFRMDLVYITYSWGGRVYKSTDGGSHWANASVPLASEDSQIGVRMRVCLYGQDRTHPGSS